jgi:hypothetical protein
VPGSIRKRSPNSWQLRVYAGVDPSSGRKRWATRMIHGSEREARRQLKRFLDEASDSRVRAGSASDLLGRWFAAASTEWSASTLLETKCLLEHHLKPDAADLAVGELTTDGWRGTRAGSDQPWRVWGCLVVVDATRVEVHTRVSLADARGRLVVAWTKMNWDLRHRKSSLVIRLMLAVWIAVVVVVLYATGRWWGLIFVVPLVLDLYLLRRILVAGSSR